MGRNNDRKCGKSGGRRSSTARYGSSRSGGIARRRIRTSRRRRGLSRPGRFAGAEGRSLCRLHARLRGGGAKVGGICVDVSGGRADTDLAADRGVPGKADGDGRPATRRPVDGGAVLHWVGQPPGGRLRSVTVAAPWDCRRSRRACEVLALAKSSSAGVIPRKWRKSTRPESTWKEDV